MDDTTFIIFGITGDLAKRSLIPALYHLVVDKKIGKFALIGAAIDDTDVVTMLDQAKEFIKDIDQALWKHLIAVTFYCQLNFTHISDYIRLRNIVDLAEQQLRLTGNRLLYCSASSKYFEGITVNSLQTGIIEKQDKKQTIRWHRIAYEKPFGHDLKSAQALYFTLKKALNDNQMFRIDHFVAKELVNNIIFIRFTNRIFEALWNKHHIEQVKITLSETLSVADRGRLYDEHGALLDVVQNHMLQMMALTSMELPQALTGSFVQRAKAEVLKKCTFINGILGQYEGYRQEEDVKPNSATETFATLTLMIKNSRWEHVPFVLETGKCLDKKATFIQITFKPVECSLYSCYPTDLNYLKITIEPDPGFGLRLNVKEPQTSDTVTPINITFCHPCLWPEFQEAYETIFEDIVNDDHSLSISFDEIEYAWRLIDEIKGACLPLYQYPKGSTGPAQAKKLTDIPLP
jgi:glucose-6-phosphate 1-dehydrogenase